MDLIYREKLKEDILKWLPQDRCGEEDYGILFEENIVVSVMMDIDEQPTVDAEEVRHGKWLVSAGGKVCTCSVCGDKFDNTCNYDIRKDWKRCPVCETKMG